MFLNFQGSVFATYKTREEAEAAQKSEDKFGDIDLVKMMQDDYWVAKNKETKVTWHLLAYLSISGKTCCRENG